MRQHRRMVPHQLQVQSRPPPFRTGHLWIPVVDAYCEVWTALIRAEFEGGIDISLVKTEEEEGWRDSI